MSKPTDAAMRAAKAWFHEPNCEAAICDLASIIDREFAGLVEAASRIARMVGNGNGPGVVVTPGECRALWDALAKIGGGA